MEIIIATYGAPFRFFLAKTAGIILCSAKACPERGVMKEEEIQIPPMDINVPAATNTPPQEPTIFVMASCKGTVELVKPLPSTPIHAIIISK